MHISKTCNGVHLKGHVIEVCEEPSYYILGGSGTLAWNYLCFLQAIEHMLSSCMNKYLKE